MFRKEFEPLLQQKTRVVILGAGFAGLEAAKTLKRAPVEITLIDRHNYHCFQPLLYQVATAALSPADIAWPVRHILRSQENANVFMAEVIGIDGDLRVVKTRAGELPFDFLVIATGAVHSYFGHENWAAVAPGLKRIEDATRIRRSILSAFEQAELIRDDAERKRLLTFVIIGGGPTGVEMAGAIAEVARQTLARDFRRIDPRTARIVLIEAGPRLLPTPIMNKAKIIAELENMVVARFSAVSRGLRIEKQTLTSNARPRPMRNIF
jgi:NADH dehydrogenase